MANVILSLILLILNTCDIVFANYDHQMYAFAETYLHSGYEKKYSLPSSSSDFVFFPSYPSNWYAISLEKNRENSFEHEIVLYKHDGIRFIKQSSYPAGYSDHFKSHVVDDELYIMLTGSNYIESTSFYYLSPNSDNLQKIFEVRNENVSDFIIWSSSVSKEIYLIIAVSSTNDSGNIVYSTKSPIFRFNKNVRNFENIGKIETINPLALSAFTIGYTTFIAVANHMNDYGDRDIDSVIYNQDNKTGKLVPYQKLKTHGAIGMTHFCFTSGNKSENFLAVANNHDDGNSPGSREVYYSTIYKWVNEFFVPFQSLDIIAPSQFVSLVGKKGEFLLLTWSSITGLTCYEYDGWKFVKSEVPFSYTDPEVAMGRIIEIDHQSLFAIGWPNNPKKSSFIYSPVYKLNTDLAEIHNNILGWYNITSTEMVSLKYADLCTVITNMERIQKIEFWINSSMVYSNPTILNMAVDNVSNILEKLIEYRWVKNVTDTSQSVLNFKIVNGRFTINFETGLMAFGPIITGKMNFVNMTGTQTEPGSYSNPYKHVSYRMVNDRRNHDILEFSAKLVEDPQCQEKGQIQFRSKQPTAMEITYQLINVLKQKDAVVPILNENCEHIKLAIFKNSKISWSDWNSTRKMFLPSQDSGVLDNKVHLSSVAAVRLKGGIGIYIEGYGNDIVGQIYTLNADGNLKFVFDLPVKEPSIVKGVIFKKFKQCFLVVSKAGHYCSFQCPAEKIYGRIPCFGISEVCVIGEDEGTDFILKNENVISIWQYHFESNVLKLQQNISTVIYSKMSATVNGDSYYIAVLTMDTIEIYRKQDKLNYSLWTVFWEDYHMSAIGIAPMPLGNLAIYTLIYHNGPPPNEDVISNFDDRLISFHSNDTSFVIWKNNNEFNIFITDLY